MKKCDFCSEQDSESVCQGFVGSNACIEAAKAFGEYMIALAKSRGSETTKNINKK